MFNNRVVHLIYRAFFLAFSSFGVINSFFRFGSGEYNETFYTYFTNISNYFAFIVAIFLFIDTLRSCLKGEMYGYCNRFKSLQFSATVCIFVTGFLYMFIGYPFVKFPEFFYTVSNITFHAFCPLLFILDYFLFCDHFKIKPIDIVYSCIFPFAYAIYILIIGSFIPNFEYPYFFLDPTEIGYFNVFMWIFPFGFFFLLVGSLFWIYDKTYFDAHKKFRIDFKNKHDIDESKD